jgi:hypothetical protein
MKPRKPKVEELEQSDDLQIKISYIATDSDTYISISHCLARKLLTQGLQ